MARSENMTRAEIAVGKVEEEREKCMYGSFKKHASRNNTQIRTRLEKLETDKY